LVHGTAHICIGIVCSNVDYIVDCITCAECYLQCNFSYHLVIVSEGDSFWGLEGLLLCEGGKDDFRIICVLSLKITG
jgi:hypothetical protein